MAEEISVEHAAAEVVRAAGDFPDTPQGRNRLRQRISVITSGQDPAMLIAALGFMVRRAADDALSEGRDDDAGLDEVDRFIDRRLDRQERRVAARRAQGEHGNPRDGGGEDDENWRCSTLLGPGVISLVGLAIEDTGPA